MNVHEECFVRSFVQPNRRSRLFSLLATKKGRAKVRGTLPHCNYLDTRFARRVPPGMQEPKAIRALLRDLGSPDTCHLISENAALDGREMPLDEALGQVVGYGFGTILSCVAGELAYFEAEDAGERYILHRPGT